MSFDNNEWNVSKHKTKSEDKSCLYKQTFNINPLMGGFSVLGDSINKSTFNVYQFTGQYKIGSGGQNNNNVVLTTTSSCSQASVSFVRALVVFQQKVEPDKRDTAVRCKQEVVFNENKYTIIISPFEQHAIDVGTLILASSGTISYTTFKLPSRTNQTKIAEALFNYIKMLNTPPKTNSNGVKTSNNIKSKLRAMALVGTNLVGSIDIEEPPSPIHNDVQFPPCKMTIYNYTPTSQSIILTGPFLAMPTDYKFVRYQVSVISTGIEVEPNSNGFYEINIGTSYNIGYIYQESDGNQGFYGNSFTPSLFLAAGTIRADRW